MDGWVGEGLAAGEDQEVEMGWLGGGDVSSVFRGTARLHAGGRLPGQEGVRRELRENSQGKKLRFDVNHGRLGAGGDGGGFRHFLGGEEEVFREVKERMGAVAEGMSFMGLFGRGSMVEVGLGGGRPWKCRRNSPRAREPLAERTDLIQY